MRVRTSLEARTSLIVVAFRLDLKLAMVMTRPRIGKAPSADHEIRPAMWLGEVPLAYRPALHAYASTNRRSRYPTYPAVCSKRATRLGNVDRPNRTPRCGRDCASGWMLSDQVFGPGGTRSKYASRICATSVP